MKRFLLVAVFGLISLCVFADGIVLPPNPTHGQVVAFVQEKGIDWAAAWIADVYTAKPSVSIPGLTGLAHGTDFTTSLDGPVVVTVSDKLRYNLTMGPWTFKGAVPQIDPWALMKAGGIGALVGVVVTVTALALTGHLK